MKKTTNFAGPGRVPDAHRNSVGSTGRIKGNAGESNGSSFNFLIWPPGPEAVVRDVYRNLDHLFLVTVVAH